MNRDICEHGNPEPCDKCKPVPPPEAKTEAEYTHPPRQWQTLSDEECEAFKKPVEEKLRARNSTLACIPAVPPG